HRRSSRRPIRSRRLHALHHLAAARDQPLSLFFAQLRSRRRFRAGHTHLYAIEYHVVPNSSPAKSVLEFIAYAKANPGKFSYGSGGIGTSVHLSGELFKRMAGIEMTHVPYRGAAPALQDVIASRLDVIFDNITASLPQVKNGAVRGLAVTAARRVPAAAELPTIAEAGVPGVDVSTWFALSVPAK